MNHNDVLTIYFVHYIFYLYLHKHVDLYVSLLC